MTLLHARLFQLGLFTVTADFRIRLSQAATFAVNASDFGIREGQAISLPSDERLHPDRDALAWHANSVFRG